MFKYLNITLCLFFITYVTGCGNDAHDDAASVDTGGAEFSLVWSDEGSNQRIVQEKGNPKMNCDEKGISVIRVDVYDGSLDNYLTGEQFFCKDGEGTVYGIPTGKNRIFKVSGKDNNGKVLYEGQSIGVEIIADKVIPVGYIEMKRFGNSLPTAEIKIPSKETTYEEGVTIDFVGLGDDAEDGPLTGDALAWTSSLMGPIGTDTKFSRSDLPIGTHEITLTVTDDDQATGSASIIISVSKKNNIMPVAKINQPLNGTFVYGDKIVFKGTGQDTEDKDLSGRNLVWKSNLVDGDIGYGESFETKTLPGGMHEITLLVKDSQGGIDVDKTEITIWSPNNSINMTFQELNTQFPDTFEMGSPEGESNFLDETQHSVVLTKPFYMQTTEVTQGQWKAVMDTKPSYFRACGDSCPVERVTWYDCIVFCNRLSKAEGLTPSYYSDKRYRNVFSRTPPVTSGTVYWKEDANGYRLPTEAEWEYAARAGSNTAFASGKMTVTDCRPDSNLNAVGWYCGNSGVTYPDCYDASRLGGPACAGTYPVEQKAANAWGLYDMHGNVWEWCQDLYGDYPTGTVTDPTGALSALGRVLRGGGWMDQSRYCRSAVRLSSKPGAQHFNLGFRVVVRPRQ